jgi:large subunit ribosomal protein L18e
MSEESAMGRKPAKTNPNLVGLIGKLKEASRVNKAPVWRDIALRLEGPSRNWAEVNISRLDRYAGENETVVVPGKLLGSGEIGKKVTVAAYRFSGQAKEKIVKAGGKDLSIEELMAKNPKGSKIRIMG